MFWMKPGLRGKPGSRVPAGGLREAQVPGVRGKPVPAAGARKAHSCAKFVHRASSLIIKSPSIDRPFFFSSVRNDEHTSYLNSLSQMMAFLSALFYSIAT